MKVLIAEDERVLATNIKEYLEDEEFEGERCEIELANNGTIAISMIKNNYDIVILDLKMPETDGIQVIEVLRHIELQKRPWVILITAYPATYEAVSMVVQMEVKALLRKPFELEDLLDKIKELAKSRRQLLDLEKHHVALHCDWTITLSELNTAFIQVNGLLNFVDSCHFPLTKLDMLRMDLGAEIARELYTTSNDDLQQYAKSQVKILGGHLFEKLFVESIQQSFVAAGSTVLHGHNLKLTFVGSRELLQIPFEFLHDSSDFFVLKYPVKRVVTKVQSKRHTSFSELLKELRDTQSKLRVLLVASNTLPSIDGVDEEVAMIHQHLKGSLGKRLVVDYLPTEEATYDEIIRRLEGCNYHIMHYAGHGSHEKVSGKGNSLFFWEKKNRQGEVRALSVNRLRNMLCLKGYDLRFIYLSCCYGTTTSDPRVLLEDDFLGIADGLIQTGVPSVLGFRWAVSDKGARRLAGAFYKSLFEQGNLDTALFHARCKVAASEDGRDIGDWLSPILIVQG